MEPTTEPPIIEIRGLAKAYGFLPALRSLDIALARHQFVALLGPNGSGKSTLLRLLSGLTRPTAGTIHIGGWSIPDEAAAVRAQIGLVSHQTLLYDSLTARENLHFYGSLYDVPPVELAQRATQLLEQVGLARRADTLVRTFSRGMQQRLSIARALIHHPHILLLDEPYTGLDQNASTVLDDLLRRAHADGHTLIMTTHLLERVPALADRVLILNRGSLVLDAPASAFTPSQLVAEYTRVTGATPAA